jgi:large subunit ribosomal protein L17
VAEPLITLAKDRQRRKPLVARLLDRLRDQAKPSASCSSRAWSALSANVRVATFAFSSAVSVPGDNAPMAYVELVDRPDAPGVEASE